jgi:integrase
MIIFLAPLAVPAKPSVHPRVVMEILDHSHISVTMNTYAHVLPETNRQAADQLDALWQEK